MAYEDIFKKLLEGRVSRQEAEALIEWLGRSEQDPEAAALLIGQLKKVVGEEEISDELRMRMEARLPDILVERRPVIGAWMRYGAVAAAVLVVVIGVGFWRHREAPVVVKAAPAAQRDIPAGKQGAILTLADGRKVVLDSLGNGVIATQSGAKVVLNSGRVEYSAGAVGEVAYNTMSTPRGRQFQVGLPDGTRVWLNAASSIRYPTVFTGGQRIVEVSGEAYFEVAKDNEHPFFVRTGTMEVQVLGTHFDVNAYTDEATVNTTLLEGAVRVKDVVLRPGQQAQTGANGNVVVGANVEKVMAWKNGVFDFQDATLEEVMRQLQRWYDIDVVYEKEVPKIEFIGKMGRDLSLSEVLGGLQVSKVHFRLEGRKLVVLP
ncbi:MAG: FecR domain-containing protein [Bacteroidetes bacterium]|nr:FecR domain-containing protein [Bacteroidota bacterium]